MRGCFAALILVAAGGSTAFAQTPPVRWNPAAPENRQVLPTFNYATVESVLTAIGASSERRGTADRPALAVTFANNRKAAILFGSCEREGAVCKAISIQAVWTAPANVPADRLAANIQRFNQRYAFSRAFLTADGRPALQRRLRLRPRQSRGQFAGFRHPVRAVRRRSPALGSFTAPAPVRVKFSKFAVPGRACDQAPSRISRDPFRQRSGQARRRWQQSS
jgi:hypothetical protein